VETTPRSGVLFNPFRSSRYSLPNELSQSDSVETRKP
jgi:hypothetical protein